MVEKDYYLKLFKKYWENLQCEINSAEMTCRNDELLKEFCHEIQGIRDQMYSLENKIKAKTGLDFDYMVGFAFISEYDNEY